MRSSSLLAGKPFEKHENVVMLINIAAKGNVSVKNLAQTIVQHLAFREMINSILTAANQEQLTYFVLIVLAEIQEREGSIYPSSFYRQLPNY